MLKILENVIRDVPGVLVSERNNLIILWSLVISFLRRGI